MGAVKYHNLDGLRGLAALIVVFSHYATVFLPSLMGSPFTKLTAVDKAASSTPLFLLFAGHYAVLIFFVLSGFVLSLSFFKYRTYEVLASSASRRYFRLMIPVLSSVLFACVILAIGGENYRHAAANITGGLWLNTLWQTPANIATAVYQGFYGAFFTGFRSYNHVLWTMQLELMGSFIVFMFLALFGKLQKRWIFYLAFSLIFIKSYYLAFILGVAICDVWSNHPNLVNRISGKFAHMLLGLGLLLGSCHLMERIGAPAYTAGVFQYLNPPFFTASEAQLLAHSLGAVFLIIAVLRLRWLTALLEARPLQYLGRVSFSLYLLHLTVLLSFSTFLFVFLYPHFGYVISFFVMFGISMLVTLGLSSLFTKFVDAPSIVLSKNIGNWLLSNSKPKAKSTPEKEPEIALAAAPVVAAATAE